MLVTVGKVLTFVEKFVPEFSKSCRRNIVQTILQKHCFGWRDRVDNMQRLDNFMKTIPEIDRKLIIEEMNIPTWSGNSPFRGSI